MFIDPNNKGQLLFTEHDFNSDILIGKIHECHYGTDSKELLDSWYIKGINILYSPK